MEKLNYSPEIENYVLGCAMTDKSCLYDLCSQCSEEDFYFKENQVVFNAMKRLHQESMPVDAHILVVDMKKHDTLSSAGGIHEVMNKAIVGNGIDMTYYISQLRDLSIRRKLVRYAHEIVDYSKDSETPACESLNKMLRNLSEVNTGRGGKFHSLPSIAHEYSSGLSFEKKIKDDVKFVQGGGNLFQGFRTGYKKLDELIGGFANGTTNIIGARSSSGKTTFLVNLFFNIFDAYPRDNIGFFSLEMPKERIFEKMLCAKASVPVSSFEERKITQEEMERLFESEKKLRYSNLWIYDYSGNSINKLKAETRKAVIKNELKIIFIDYLGRIQSEYKNQNKHIQIDEISKGLQDIALELNIPVVTLAQLNRNIFNRADKVPVLADLRESGSIEEDADTVMLLHRPKHFDTTRMDDITEIHLSKNRLRGHLGQVHFDYHCGRLVERESLEAIMEKKKNLNEWSDYY